MVGGYVFFVNVVIVLVVFLFVFKMVLLFCVFLVVVEFVCVFCGVGVLGMWLGVGVCVVLWWLCVCVVGVGFVEYGVVVVELDVFVKMVGWVSVGFGVVV